ncbi:L,D-transpeptidase [Phenylobacterium sp.]|uniref:L,D-transpeptidase family protein n=1 Tax=Phenylobacterium sp. TaxID=1871053 RepID=UPI0025EED18A|nr:L,D-transpeptidase [Phenylobacterium sp.]
MKFSPVLLCGVAAAALSACEIRPRETASASQTSAPPAASMPSPAVPETQPAPSAAAVAQAVDRAAFSEQPATPEARRDMLIRAQVLLDRAHFSPGVIDGQDGENMRNAIAAYERAHDLPEDGILDAEVWGKLTADAGPALVDYVVSREDAAGPYTPEIPKRYEDMAKLDRLGFSGPLEALAERFHMDVALLQALNPGADFGAAGTRIVVAWPARDALPTKVATVEVDKTRKQVRAYDAAGELLAAYPATVGSADLPTPSGEWAVRTIAPAPTWTYDPSRLNFGDKSAGKLTIRAGPNNPVGAVWIDLTKDTYGIHGAPEPRLVGKTASHGCVRLTNWDAMQLSKAVEKGTKVKFVGDGPAAVT